MLTFRYLLINKHWQKEKTMATDGSEKLEIIAILNYLVNNGGRAMCVEGRVAPDTLIDAVVSNNGSKFRVSYGNITIHFDAPQDLIGKYADYIGSDIAHLIIKIKGYAQSDHEKRLKIVI